MNWNSNLGFTEWFFIVGFIVIYVVYYLKVFKTSKILGSRLRNFEFKFILRSFILSLLLIAICGPRFGSSETDQLNNASDLYFAIDLSESMNLNDIDPNRLSRLKFELLKIIPKLSQNKIGLIIFSEEAFQILPLTFDMDRVVNEIKNLNTDIFINHGTVLESPLRLIDSKYSEDNEKPITLVVFTDGEDFGVFDRQLQENLKDKNVQIQFFGIGTKKGQVVPLPYSKDNNISKLNSEYLKDLNSDFSAPYLELTNSNNDFEDLVYEINNRSTWLRDARKYNAKDNKYSYFLLLAIALICIDVLWVNRIMKF